MQMIYQAVAKIPKKRLTILIAIRSKPPILKIRPFSSLNCSKRSFFAVSFIQKIDLELLYAKKPIHKVRRCEI